MTPQNPALEPEPEQPQEHSYRVTAPSPVLGRDPGEVFTATVPLEQEKFLLDIGALTYSNQPVEDAPEPVERTYKVTAPSPVLGHAPGEQFTAVLDLEHEKQLLDQGALEVVAPKPAKPKGAKPATEKE